MRDRRFVRIHRGGLLTVEDHRMLLTWALSCALHVADISRVIKLQQAVQTARNWLDGTVSTGAAMNAARIVHSHARQVEKPLVRLVARAVGQAVATAHMADHFLGAAWYALNIVKESNGNVDIKLQWQKEQLAAFPMHLSELICSTMRKIS